jgi:predicted nucleotidyltransferase
MVYGNVARSLATRDSDFDMLVIFENLPRSIFVRVRLFKRAEDLIQPLLDDLMDSGCAVALSQVIKTRSETTRFSQIYIDMTEDAAIVYDKGGFFEGVLTRLIKRLRELGVWVNDKSWYWVLKGDYKFGEVIEIE